LLNLKLIGFAYILNNIIGFFIAGYELESRGIMVLRPAPERGEKEGE